MVGKVGVVGIVKVGDAGVLGKVEEGRVSEVGGKVCAAWSVEGGRRSVGGELDVEEIVTRDGERGSMMPKKRRTDIMGRNSLICNCFSMRITP